MTNLLLPERITMKPSSTRSTIAAKPTRREFIQSSIVAGTTLALGTGLAGAFQGAKPDEKVAETPSGGKMHILILGGTGFLGPAIIDAANARGHTITIFNRGVTEKRALRNVGDVERLVGDRDPNKGEGLKALEGRKFDVVFDDCGYYPRMVKASAELLGPNVRQYVYISSISAFKDNSKPNQDETAEVGTMDDPTIESMGDQFQFYGPLKALCEQAADKAVPGKVTNVRPGYIVGPGDPTDRFTYWPVRVQKGGDVLAPGTPDDPIQVIDVRDLAKWLVHIAENNITGLFNATGPAKKLTMGETLAACKTASKSDATFTWVPADFLKEQAKDEDNLPIWIAPQGEYAGFHTWKVDRAINAGLTFMPIEQTCADLLVWWPKELDRRERATKAMIEEAKAKGDPGATDKFPDWSKLRAGISMEREAEVLAAWKKQQETAKG